MNKRKAPSTAFKPGQSGNPAGKPKGARNHATRLVLSLMEDGAEEIAKSVIEAAKGGDFSAARLVLERLVPPMRERPVSLKLPDTTTAEGICKAQQAILEAVGNGDLTPGEGTTLASIAETLRKSLETEELERRIAALEAKE